MKKKREGSVNAADGNGKFYRIDHKVNDKKHGEAENGDLEMDPSTSPLWSGESLKEVT